MANYNGDSSELHSMNELYSQSVGEFPLQRSGVSESFDLRTEVHNSGHDNLTSWSSAINNSDLCMTRSESLPNNDAQNDQPVSPFLHEQNPLEVISHDSVISEPQDLGSLATSWAQPDDQTTSGPQPNEPIQTSNCPQPSNQSLTANGPQPGDCSTSGSQPGNHNQAIKNHSLAISEFYSLQSEDENLMSSESQSLQPEGVNSTNRESQSLQPEGVNSTNRESQFLQPEGVNSTNRESQSLQPEGVNSTNRESQFLQSEDVNLTTCKSQSFLLENDNFKNVSSLLQPKDHNVTTKETQSLEAEDHTLTSSDLHFLPSNNKTLTNFETLLKPSDQNLAISESRHLEPEDFSLSNEIVINNCTSNEAQVTNINFPTSLETNNVIFSKEISDIESGDLIKLEYPEYSFPWQTEDSQSQTNTNNYNFPFGNLPELRILLKKCDVPADSAYKHHMSTNKNEKHVDSAGGQKNVATNSLISSVRVLDQTDKSPLPVKRKVGRPRKSITENVKSPEKAESDCGNKGQEKFSYRFKLRETDLKKIKEQSQFYNEFKLGDIDPTLKSRSVASKFDFQNLQNIRKRSKSNKEHVIGENTRKEEVHTINRDDSPKNVKLNKKIGLSKKTKVQVGKTDGIKENTWAITTSPKIQVNDTSPVPEKRPRGRPPKKRLQGIRHGSDSSSEQMSTCKQESGPSSTVKTKVKCDPKEEKQKLHTRFRFSPKGMFSSSRDVAAKKPKLSGITTLQNLKKANKRNKFDGSRGISKQNLRSFGGEKKLSSKLVPNHKLPGKRKRKFGSKKKVNTKEAERCESPVYNPTSPIVEMDHDIEADFEELFSLGLESSNRESSPKKLTDSSKKSLVEKPPSDAPYPLSFIYSKSPTGKACDLTHACCQKCSQVKVEASTQWEDPTEMFAAIDAAVSEAQIPTRFIPQIKRYVITESTQYQQQPNRTSPFKVQGKRQTLHEQPSQTCHVIQSNQVSAALQPNQWSAATSHYYSQQSPQNSSYQTPSFSQDSLNFQQSQMQQQQMQQVSRSLLNRISQSLQVKEVSQVLQAHTTSSQPVTSQMMGFMGTSCSNLSNAGGVSSSSHTFFSNNLQVPVAQVGQLTSGTQLTPFLLVPMTTQNLQGLSGFQTETKQRKGKQSQAEAGRPSSQRQESKKVKGPKKGPKSSSKPSATTVGPSEPRCDVVLGGGVRRADFKNEQDGFIGLELDVSCEENENSSDSLKNSERGVNNNDNSSDGTCTEDPDYIYIG